MHIIKQGDLFPPIDDIVKDENDVVVDVTGATIQFSMREAREPSSVKISLANGSVVNGAQGKIRYQPAGTDTDTPGTYEAEFRVTPLIGNPMRVPTTGYITVVVEAKVA